MFVSGKYLAVQVPQVGNMSIMSEDLIDEVSDFIVNLPAEVKNAKKRMRIVRMRQKRRDCKRKRETLKAQRWNHNAKLYASGKLTGYPIRDEKRIKEIMKEAKRGDDALDGEPDGGQYDENYMDYVVWLEDQGKEVGELDDRLEAAFDYYDDWNWHNEIEDDEVEEFFFPTDSVQEDLAVAKCTEVLNLMHEAMS